MRPPNGRRVVIIGLLAMAAQLIASEPCPAVGEIGDRSVHPAPPPALPGAGRQFRDPTYGTVIVQVTDEQDGAWAFHPYSQWSPFNSTSTRFYLYNERTGWTLYEFNPETLAVRKSGPVALSPDGNLDMAYAQWDAADPAVFYATIPDTAIRKLYAYNVATATATLVRDFAGLVQTGGYTSGLMSSANSRYFTFWVSSVSGGGQGSGNVVVVYDRVLDHVYQITLSPAQVGVGVHALYMDKAGDYVLIWTNQPNPVGSTTEPVWLIWHFRNGTLFRS